MTVRVSFKPQCTNRAFVNYDANTFTIEEDESISLLDVDGNLVGSVCSGVWEDVLLIGEVTDAHRD